MVKIIYIGQNSERQETYKLVERDEDKFWCERIQISNSKKQHDV